MKPGNFSPQIVDHATHGVTTKAHFTFSLSPAFICGPLSKMRSKVGRWRVRLGNRIQLNAVDVVVQLLSAIWALGPKVRGIDFGRTLLG